MNITADKSETTTDSTIAAEIKSASEYISAVFERWKPGFVPRAGLVIGTGLTSLSDSMSDSISIPYRQIPHFPVSTADSHVGALASGFLESVPVVLMNGRFHPYEGWSMAEIALPIHVLHQLGVRTLIVTNASGGMNVQHRRGDIILIEDHINFFRGRPFGLAKEGLPVPAMDRTNYYDRGYIESMERIAMSERIRLHRGVYLSTTGPNFETRAEYRFFRKLGADVVGASSVPEVLTANSLGMKVIALSVITNVCLPDQPERPTGASVIQTATQSSEKLQRLILRFLGDQLSQINQIVPT